MPATPQIDTSPANIARVLRELANRTAQLSDQHVSNGPVSQSLLAESLAGYALADALEHQAAKCPECGGENGYHRADVDVYCSTLRASLVPWAERVKAAQSAFEKSRDDCVDTVHISEALRAAFPELAPKE